MHTLTHRYIHAYTYIYTCRCGTARPVEAPLTCVLWMLRVGEEVAALQVICVYVRACSFVLVLCVRVRACVRACLCVVCLCACVCVCVWDLRRLTRTRFLCVYARTSTICMCAQKCSCTFWRTRSLLNVCIPSCNICLLNVCILNMCIPASHQ